MKGRACQVAQTRYTLLDFDVCHAVQFFTLVHDYVLLSLNGRGDFTWNRMIKEGKYSKLLLETRSNTYTLATWISSNNCIRSLLFVIFSVCWDYCHDFSFRKHKTIRFVFVIGSWTVTLLKRIVSFVTVLYLVFGCVLQQQWMGQNLEQQTPCSCMYALLHDREITIRVLNIVEHLNQAHGNNSATEIALYSSWNCYEIAKLHDHYKTLFDFNAINNMWLWVLILTLLYCFFMILHDCNGRANFTWDHIVRSGNYPKIVTDPLLVLQQYTPDKCYNNRCALCCWILMLLPLAYIFFNIMDVCCNYMDVRCKYI
ncbi:hypothetical protein RFI_36389 [Reticulomyxa filosa]|uniref:Uncharacterized protein n=1 Tax=Reticulomyxa filosa TaxID=46433 RepID=X6LI59_RETFI|nr:hypothetical protein RFI_36389 [Reticulomyxa filosa]|eukprot:ETO01051.1 hypothetical protein RFI_36389 [Reticulomyxa filosa]